MRLHAALARALRDHGTDTLFGLIGDANLFMVDGFVHDEKGTYVGAAHEAGAVLMAYGYANRSGRLGVATVTHGPGLTNTLTALVEGVKSRTPLLLIAGDTPASIRNHMQDIPQREVILSSGSGFEQAASPQTALADLSVGIRRAHDERRPIVLNVPAQFMWEEIEYRRVPTSLVGKAVQQDADALDRAVGIVASAQRPVVLMGRGVTNEARPPVLRLAERIGALVATTLGGKGHLNGECFGLGIFGTLSTPVANDVILSADCIIAFGASLNPFTTADGSLVKGKALVQCDIDPASIGVHVPVDAAVMGDAGSTATAMIGLLDQAEIQPTAFRSQALAERLADLPSAADLRDISWESAIEICTALARLNSAIPRNRTVVLDAGRFMGPAFRLLDAPNPSAWCYAVAFGSIGLGTGTAIGAGVAAPGAPAVCVSGDGGFMNGGLTEFNTAVRHKVDLITIVCNDHAYGAEHTQLRNRGLDPGITIFDWPDFAPVADALGGRGVTVRSVADLDLAEQAIRERDRPLLIDLKLDPDRIPPLTLPSSAWHRPDLESDTPR
jgi:thiamine pyrophosphate-dependent acetolactate synthase large subunit-like protein